MNDNTSFGTIKGGPTNQIASLSHPMPPDDARRYRRVAFVLDEKATAGLLFDA